MVVGKGRSEARAVGCRAYSGLVARRGGLAQA